MATAKKAGGLYYTPEGDAIDANGDPVEGAPKRPKDTDPKLQPGAAGAALSQADVMGQALAKGLVEAQRMMKRGDADESDDESKDKGRVVGNIGDLPTIAELPDAIAKLDAAEVKAMMKRDERVTAEPIYQKRLDELKAE